MINVFIPHRWNNNDYPIRCARPVTGRLYEVLNIRRIIQGFQYSSGKGNAASVDEDFGIGMGIGIKVHDSELQRRKINFSSRHSKLPFSVLVLLISTVDDCIHDSEKLITFFT